MATRKAVKKRPKTVARKTKTVARKTKTAPRKPTKRAARKSTARKPATRKSARKRPVSRRPARTKAPAPPKVREGLITHTELASSDPVATRAWCERVLGWTFGEPMSTPTGPYHMWQFPNQTGGGIRANHPPEVPGSIPYCEVANIQATYDQALDAGATPMFPPEPLPGGMGWIAIVAAPGGVAIGFWSMG